ncbi:hypothetical protein, partial [Halovulum sp. GXIMD14793]
ASCSLIIPMIWTSVKRLFRIRLLLQKVEQTLHQNEGSFGRQVTAFAASLLAVPLQAGNVEPFVVVEEVVQPAGSNAGWIVLGLAAIAIGIAIATSDDDDGNNEEPTGRVAVD